MNTSKLTLADFKPGDRVEILYAPEVRDHQIGAHGTVKDGTGHSMAKLFTEQVFIDVEAGVGYSGGFWFCPWWLRKLSLLEAMVEEV